MSHRKNLVALALLLCATTLFAAANIGPNSFLPKITPVNAVQCPTGGSTTNACLTVSLSARSSVVPTAGTLCATQAALSGQRPVCDTTIRPIASNATTFRVGAILNVSSAANAVNGVFGWQYGILYNTTAVVPQADLSHQPNDPAGFTLCAGYPDCSEKTV